MEQEAYLRAKGIQPLILVDLDSTIAEFRWPGIDDYDPFVIGLPITGAREMMKELCRIAIVKVTTSRFSFVKSSERTLLRDRILLWLDEYNFPADVKVQMDGMPFHIVYIGDETINPWSDGHLKLGVRNIILNATKLVQHYEKEQFSQSEYLSHLDEDRSVIS